MSSSEGKFGIKAYERHKEKDKTQLLEERKDSIRKWTSDQYPNYPCFARNFNEIQKLELERCDVEFSLDNNEIGVDEFTIRIDDIQRKLRQLSKFYRQWYVYGHGDPLVQMPAWVGKEKFDD